MLKYLTAGESHGPSLCAILEGFPAGVEVPRAFIAAQLARRRLASGRSARQGLEKEDFEVTGGLRGDVTTGAPISVILPNASRALPRASSVPRPGHADLGGMLKYGLDDAALVRERASARETAARCALGSFALKLCELLGVRIQSSVASLGSLRPVTPETAARELARAKKAGDTLGGEFEVLISGAPAGLGGYSQGVRRLGARFAEAMFSIPAVKGFEVGAGFALAALPGSAAAADASARGGLDGGMTGGGAITLRCAVKPVPGIEAGAPSRDARTGKKKLSVSTTSDTTAVFGAAVVGEHAAALVLTEAILEKFGGDSLAELLPRVREWRKRTKR